MDVYEKIVIERAENATGFIAYPAGFIAYPAGLNVPRRVIGRGESPQEALADLLPSTERHGEELGLKSPPAKKDCAQLACANGTLLANIIQNGSTREVIVVGQCPCRLNPPEIPLQECRQLAESLLAVLKNQ